MPREAFFADPLILKKVQGAEWSVDFALNDRPAGNGARHYRAKMVSVLVGPNAVALNPLKPCKVPSKSNMSH